MSMASHFADADDDSTVLDGVIGVEQLRSHAANIWPDALGDHLLEPVCVNGFHIIVD